ncbi:hypothetical protein IEO21_00832 [Rhodonia placenta]|uniref:Uncharacterized protein n=1 Tax=Rhodonia placenta TaxID=104341 RepID=A0A8H7U652_9APHY|nr:hypothetical protein IEO21_00832 [Postia placenta]
MANISATPNTSSS